MRIYIIGNDGSHAVPLWDAVRAQLASKAGLMSHSLLVGDWLFAPLPWFRPREYRQFNRLLTEIEEIGLGGALLGNCGSQFHVAWIR
jgi:hypothetical protein